MSVNYQELYDTDYLAVLNSLRRFNFISEETYDRFLRKYRKHNRENTLERQDEFIAAVLNVTSRDNLIQALQDSGNMHLYSRVYSSDVTVLPIMERFKLELKNELTLGEFFANNKSFADDNIFKRGSIMHFRNVIKTLTERIGLAAENPDRLQLLVNKRILVQFLLAQQHSDIEKRYKILKKMHDLMPGGVDWTFYRIVYHSSMSMNRAIKGEANTAEKHEQIALQENDKYSSKFLEAFVRIGCIYKNDAISLIFGSEDHFQKARDNFYRILDSTNDMGEDEKNVNRNLACVEYACTLLGIGKDFVICDIKSLTTKHILEARNILTNIDIDQLPERRKMKYFLCRGRTHELADINLAIGDFNEAFRLAEKQNEKSNIREYIDRLWLQQQAVLQSQ